VCPGPCRDREDTAVNYLAPAPALASFPDSRPAAGMKPEDNPPVVSEDRVGTAFSLRGGGALGHEGGQGPAMGSGHNQ
jgi:hypothetical protein